MLRSLFRVFLAAVVLAAVCIAWLILFLLFAPFLLIASLIRKPDPRHPRYADLVTTTTDNSIPLIFDRRNDVSKLYGCNTRNVRYRWSLFEKRLDGLQREFETPAALDFGAGSLRDTYELANRGFKVTAFDLNDAVLQRYYESYDWTKAATPATVMSGSVEDLSKSDPVQLIIAFDVIEHLEDPASYIQTFNTILCDDGFLFTIVPNKRSLFERYFKRSLAQQIKRGAVLEPGVPHVQFRTPEEWDQFFEANGFRIVDRDMTIGHFVNDWWNGLLAVPLRSYVYPVLEVIAYRGKFNWNVGRIEATLCPPWLMERVNVLDQWLKSWSKCCFGWNLIVAQKRPQITPITQMPTKSAQSA